MISIDPTMTDNSASNTRSRGNGRPPQGRCASARIMRVQSVSDSVTLRTAMLLLSAVLTTLAPTALGESWNGLCQPYVCMALGTDCQCYTCYPDPAAPICENLVNHEGCPLDIGGTTARAYCTGAPPYAGGGSGSGGSGGGGGDPFGELGPGISDCASLQTIIEWPPSGIPPELLLRCWEVWMSQGCGGNPGDAENQIP